MTKCLKYDPESSSIHLEISRHDLHRIIEGLNTLLEKRKGKIYDELEKDNMKRCRELLHDLYEIAKKGYHITHY